MAKKSSRKKKGSKSSSSVNDPSHHSGLIEVDPARVRFQHSKIRPYFSTCGRSVHDTLGSIRRGELSPSDLPPIQVLVGPTDESGPWYFSLNNRRLWVLKRCREEGLLVGNRIQVRVRDPKSDSEAKRYSLDNCALEAKFIREKGPTLKIDGLGLMQGEDVEEEARGSVQRFVENETVQRQGDGVAGSVELVDHPSNKDFDERDSATSESDSSIDDVRVSNRFSALLM